MPGELGLADLNDTNDSKSVLLDIEIESAAELPSDIANFSIRMRRLTSRGDVGAASLRLAEEMSI